MSTAFRFVSLESQAREAVLAMKEQTLILHGTGLRQVDDMLAGGIAPGEVCVVGARPSHGKTLFGLQWCYQVAAAGHPCLVISEEMTPALLAQRTVSYASSVSECQRKERNDDVFDDVVSFFEPRRPIMIAEGCRRADRAAEAIAQARTHYGCRFAVVDYLQLLRGDGREKYEQVSDASLALKSAAVENNVALVLLAQLSRGVETRGEFLPRLHDLRDSGQIEQDADCVLFLVWPWKVDDAKSRYEYRIYGAKNRNRGIRGDGVARLTIDPTRQMLIDPKQDDPRPGDRVEAFDAWNNEETF